MSTIAPSAAPPRALVERPQTFEEMAARPGFQVVLEPEEHPLAAVVSDYSFASMIPCGIGKCRTPHRNGYLVATVDGLETNVGHACGKKNLGESFEVLRSAYEARRAREDLMLQARRILANAPALLQRIHDLNRGRHGMRWAHKVRAALQAVLGDEVFPALVAGAKRGDLKVREARERTEAEIDSLVAMGEPREQVRIETIEVGELVPMPWLGYDFGAKLREGLLSPLSEFTALDLDALTTPKLRAWVKRFDGADQTLDEAAAVLASVIELFAKQNLAMLGRWVPDTFAKKRRAVIEWSSSKACRELMSGEAVPPAVIQQ